MIGRTLLALISAVLTPAAAMAGEEGAPGPRKTLVTPMGLVAKGGGTPVKILLAGAAGYTGKGLAEVLKADGHWVRGCDVIAKMEHVDEAAAGDIADLEVCRRMTDGVEAMVLCHMAPKPKGYETPQLAMDVNVKGTANLYHAAVERKLSRTVLISSTGTLADGAGVAVPGDGPYGYGNKHKMTLYALTKVFQESLARWYWETRRMPTAIIRPSYVVCDGTLTNKYGKPVQVYSPDLIDPRDIGWAVSRALALPDLGLEAFNIGQEGAGFDLSAAHDRLGWRPRHLFEALRKTDAGQR